MIRGPTEYVPSVEVEVVTKRQAIPLDENEGIYVRDIKTGKVSELSEVSTLDLIFFSFYSSVIGFKCLAIKTKRWITFISRSLVMFPSVFFSWG